MQNDAVEIHVFMRRNFDDNLNRQLLSQSFGENFMRHYAFYLAVALLAFGFSSFVVYTVYDKYAKIPRITETKINPVIEIGPKDAILQKQTRVKKADEINAIILKKLPCEDKYLQFIWKNLTGEVGYTFSDNLEDMDDCSDFISVDKFVDLNNDGQSEIMIVGNKIPFCSSGGCDIWIFQKNSRERYKKLFSIFGSVKVMKSKTNGYRDLEHSFRFSSDEFSRKVYKFNGIKYIPNQCQMEHLTYLNEKGKVVLLKKPRITPYKCE
jgi:hypothetical protein